jgi:hypothetical protein
MRINSVYQTINVASPTSDANVEPCPQTPRTCHISHNTCRRPRLRAIDEGKCGPPPTQDLSEPAAHIFPRRSPSPARDLVTTRVAIWQLE